MKKRNVVLLIFFILLLSSCNKRVEVEFDISNFEQEYILDEMTLGDDTTISDLRENGIASFIYKSDDQDITYERYYLIDNSFVEYLVVVNYILSTYSEDIINEFEDLNDIKYISVSANEKILYISSSTYSELSSENTFAIDIIDFIDNHDDATIDIIDSIEKFAGLNVSNIFLPLIYGGNNESSNFSSALNVILANDIDTNQYFYFDTNNISIIKGSLSNDSIDIGITITEGVIVVINQKNSIFLID